MQCVSPPKRGAPEPVNLKTHRNPAKTARGPFGLVRSRAHFFARISCVFKVVRAIVWADGFRPFAETKGQKKPRLQQPEIF
jgi:hypothetical protein